MIDLDELKVPKAVRLVAGEIVAITDVVCRAVLDEEYADLTRGAFPGSSTRRLRSTPPARSPARPTSPTW
jgi:hypothetical protein